MDPSGKYTIMTDNVDITFGPDAVHVPSGDVLYLDQLLVGEDGHVRIDAVPGDLVHLVCPGDAVIRDMAGLDAAATTSAVVTDAGDASPVHMVMVNDITMYASSEIAIHILDM